jgi:hypothetical protein
MVATPQIGRKLRGKRALKANAHPPQVPILTNAPPIGALAALMQEWQAEDASMSAEEAEQAAEDLQAFQAALNANRQATSERSVYP